MNQLCWETWKNFVTSRFRLLSMLLCFTGDMLVHLQMKQHDVYPRIRLPAGKAEAGLGVQTVVALERTGE